MKEQGNRLGWKARLLRGLSRPFLRIKVFGEENVINDPEPKIYVCNHGFWYGPIVAAAYLPGRFRPWIHDRVLSCNTFMEIVFEAFESKLKCMSSRGQRHLARRLYRIVKPVLNAFHPIPVVKGCVRDVYTTFKTSVETLAEGASLLIFPEQPRTHCVESMEQEIENANKLRNLYTGFVQIGKMYYDKYGTRLKFYPVYADKKRRRLTIGDAVAYDPSIEPKRAKTFMSNQLYERMMLMEAGGF